MMIGCASCSKNTRQRPKAATPGPWIGGGLIRRNIFGEWSPNRVLPFMITVRRATRQDVPAVLEIYNDAVLNTTASADYEPRSLDSRYTWFDEHAREGYPIFVAVSEEGGIVGWSSL